MNPKFSPYRKEGRYKTMLDWIQAEEIYRHKPVEEEGPKELDFNHD